MTAFSTLARALPAILAMLSAVAACIGASTSAAKADDDFYRGKALTVVIGFTPGGGYDAFGRMIARHMPRHIPGTPTGVPQNMPGAGSMTAVRYLDATAPKDGTVLVTFNPTLITQSIVTPDAVKMKFTDLAWVGTATEEFRVCYAWHTTGIKSWDDLVAAKEFVIGATAAGTANYVNGVVLRNVFGIRIRQILGYPGAAEQRLATERGELDGGCSEWFTISEDWTQNGKIVPLVRWLPTAPAAFGFDIPYIGDLAKNDGDRDLLRMLTAPSRLGNPFVASKRVPAERLAMLRKAFDATVRDPEFLADSKRYHLPVEATSGADAEKIAAEIYASATPALIARAKEAMK